MLLKLLADRESESRLPRRVASSGRVPAMAAATCAEICSPLGAGDAGGAEAGARCDLPAVSSAVVFIVRTHTHSQVYRVNTLSGTTPKREQEANLFICQLLGE